jgi:hypothetical protein
MSDNEEDFELPSKTTIQCVTTHIRDKITSSEEHCLIPCPVCTRPFFKKVPWQENCSDKCRSKSFKLKQAAKIADQVREDVYNLLIERLVK